MYPRRLAATLTIALIVTSTSSCLVRARTGRSSAAVQGHPDKHNHDHCHERGGKHDKKVCHSHPHGPGHH